ncbi:MAG: hypothetical protein ISS18_15830 [Bacteroidales bacterium]|nr:hypothetical protein [Bacteroidales bacterium]
MGLSLNTSLKNINDWHMIKKYFILLLIFIPLSRVLTGLAMMLGPRLLIEMYSSPEEYMNNFDALLSNIEIISFYASTTILSLVVFVDLKRNIKLIGIPILTILSPVFGVTLYMIQYYYTKQIENGKYIL